jgi:hypothetical protein
MSTKTTAQLIADYDKAISSTKGRYTEQSPRQMRINKLVEELGARADAGDAEAEGWLVA